MIDPASVALFVPPELKKFKLDLFNRIGKTIEAAGGRIIRHDIAALDNLPDNIIPIVGCSIQLREIVAMWRARKRSFIYWDRGYCRRVFATWLPRGEDGGYYRWHANSWQMQQVREVSNDRWLALKTPITPWQKGGRHIVVAQPTPTYARFHGIEGWTDKTLDALSLVTDRQIIIRSKESRRPLQDDLEDAHCLVAHASIAAVESVICGCPVFVDPESAASLVGVTDLSKIEEPIYPDRRPWLNSLAYSQWNEHELVDGMLWKMLE